MKNLKKFAALLLAGAMALLMLTACGGGGSVNNPEEQKSICERISKVRCSLATTSSSPRSM